MPRWYAWWLARHHAACTAAPGNSTDTTPHSACYLIASPRPQHSQQAHRCFGSCSAGGAHPAGPLPRSLPRSPMGQPPRTCTPGPWPGPGWQRRQRACAWTSRLQPGACLQGGRSGVLSQAEKRGLCIQCAIKLIACIEADGTMAGHMLCSWASTDEAGIGVCCRCRCKWAPC